MPRPLFCELGPLAYRISRGKGIFLRRLQDLFSGEKFAREKGESLLPTVIYRHRSLIRRKLGQVDPVLQENKAVNLGLAAPKVDKILIRPGEIFSFWRLVGSCTGKKGYREGLVIANGEPGRGVGGGMCQFTNLLHWLVLHSPLTVTEHHHHNQVDLFPDYRRQVPFGCGTSIFYNYRDYRFKNTTDQAFQLTVWTDDQYLNGELRAERPLDRSYHIHEEEARFENREGGYWRHNKIYRKTVDKKTGNTLSDELLIENNARVLYPFPPA